MFKARAAKGEFTPRDSTVVDEQRFRQIEKNGTNPPEFVTNPPFGVLRGDPRPMRPKNPAAKRRKKAAKKMESLTTKSTSSFAQFFCASLRRKNSTPTKSSAAMFAKGRNEEENFLRLMRNAERAEEGAE